MKQEEVKNFDTEAAKWEENPGRVKLANDVADAMIKAVELRKDMDALDFGCGTGLVTLRLQPFVGSVTGADSSKGMLAVLEKKVKDQGLSNVKTQFVDFEKGGRVSGAFDLIVSSMTLHHVPDPEALFKKWHSMLKPKGLICFADLDTEDGSFHPDKTGVFHFGFDRVKLKKNLESTGFHDLSDITAATVKRDAEGIGKKQYPVFLISGRKTR